MRKLAITVISLLLIPGAIAQDGKQCQSHRVPTPMLTESEAKQLATIALPKGTVDLPKFSLDPFHTSGVCIAFDGLWDNPVGSVHIDFWLVNRKTGEVWRGVDPVCRRVSSHALASAQKQIRKELGISAAEVRQERHRICCVDVLQ